MLTAIIALNVTGYCAYNNADFLKTYVDQDQLIMIIMSLVIIEFILYAFIASKAKFNTAGLWMSIPMILLGGYLVGSAYSKLGKEKTFFGRELNGLDHKDMECFPFSIGHAQYKGCIIMILGFWFAFRHTHELTAMTGVWIISFMIQMAVETPPNVVVPNIQKPN